MTEPLPPRERRRRLMELAGVFLKLGATAFGGPAAHVALLQEEIVHRRQWITREAFVDLLGATNLIPGPNSTEMVIHIGQRRAGWAGLVVAGACFILPAALIVTVIAWAYVRFGQLPKAEGLLYGAKPVIIAVVVQALWSLRKSALKTQPLALAGAAVATLAFLGVNELILLFGAGLVFAAGRNMKRATGGGAADLFGATPALPLALSTGSAAAAASAFGLWPMFLFFLKIGSVLFGSGYVLLAFLRADLVDHWHWLSEGQLLDAVAVGQFTPGPLLTTATFIGYLLAGTPGAALATVGIFLPAFFFVAISGPLIPRLRRSPTAGAFLDGVNAASLALMAVVCWQLGRAALVDWLTALIALASAVMLVRFRVNSVWLVLGGALAGLLVRLLRG